MISILPQPTSSGRATSCSPFSPLPVADQSSPLPQASCPSPPHLLEVPLDIYLLSLCLLQPMTTLSLSLSFLSWTLDEYSSVLLFALYFLMISIYMAGTEKIRVTPSFYSYCP